MRTTRLVFGVLLATLISPAHPATAEPAEANGRPTPDPAAAVQALQGVAGRVLGGDSLSGDGLPLSAARVYAFQLADASLHRVVTDDAGSFRFDTLPVGLYKVIAHKAGFVPAVVMLTRATADAYQFVEVRLAPERLGSVGQGEDFWSVRARIPPDVLREITIAEFEAQVRNARHGLDLPPGMRLETEMRAMAGRDHIASLGEGDLTSGGIGLAGRIGDLEIDFDGDFRQLETRGLSAAGLGGQENRLSVRVANGDDTLVNVTSLSNKLQPLEQQSIPGVPGAEDVDFEHYRVSVSQALGNRAHSEFAAQYTSENNFHRHGWVDPLDIPGASESWRLEASYSTLLAERTQLETGFRYREQRVRDDSSGLVLQPFGHERMDFFGRAGSQLLPAVFVEYGLYTTLRDGSLSLAPRGGLVIDLGDAWKAAATVSQTAYDEAPDGLRYFEPVFHGDSADCDAREKSCYRVVLSRTYGEGESGDRGGELSFGAVHRELSDTRRLYFSNDFFDRLESLYMVPGDELPEVSVGFSRRLSPTVLARFQSNLASGGGGIFYATDQEAYENTVRYLVTSVDTRFQGTETGLFVAFHHLEQELSPMQPHLRVPAPLELERLQVMLTQDLGILAELTDDLALQLNMELSRGTDPFSATPDDELRKRILGGFAVKF